jgi:hypothetical protein
MDFKNEIKKEVSKAPEKKEAPKKPAGAKKPVDVCEKCKYTYGAMFCLSCVVYIDKEQAAAAEKLN